MVGFDGTELNDDLRFLIGTLKVGGIILFSRNIATPDQVATLCADARAFARTCGQPPLLIAVDQEGGQVARLRAPFTEFPGNPAMAGTADADRFARITARELLGIGINMNMAPVMDVAWEDVESVMAARAFGTDPERVARLGCAVIDRMQEEGVMAVAKHFPGIGRTTLDSHLVQPVLDTPVSELESFDFPPFEAAVRQGVSGVMLSHILYRPLDDRWPASLSVRIARDLLRRRMGYTGVVMTDDLDMKSIRGRYDMATVVDRIVAAQIDLALVCHKGPDREACFRELLKKIETSEECKRAAQASAGRITGLKAEYKVS